MNLDSTLINNLDRIKKNFKVKAEHEILTSNCNTFIYKTYKDQGIYYVDIYRESNINQNLEFRTSSRYDTRENLLQGLYGWTYYFYDNA